MKKSRFLCLLPILLSVSLSSCDLMSVMTPSARKRSSREEMSIKDKSSNDEPSSKTSSYHNHSWGEAVVTKAPTCTEDGSQTMTCTICGQERTQKIPATGHSEAPADDSPSWTMVTEPTCEQPGMRTYVCNRCYCAVEVEVPALGHMYAFGEDDKYVVEWINAPTCTEDGFGTITCTRPGCGHTEYISEAALGHEFVDAVDQSGAVEPTCTKSGIRMQECTRCHATQTIIVDALGHDFSNPHALEIPGPTETNTRGEIPFRWANITNYSCSRGDSYRYLWSAKEVNFDYANEGVHWTYEEVDSAQEGDPAYGKTTSDWKTEPSLVDDGDGIRFWGRPIGNAMELDSQGMPIDRGDTPKVPDSTVKGSRFEFDFVFDEDLTDVHLLADLTPAQYTNDVFKNRTGDQEWFPGYRFVDDDGNPATPSVAAQIEEMRYIIYLDGVEVPLDNSISTTPNGRGWYQFPCKLNLSKGKHNLNIAMAGGYFHTFYNFSFENTPSSHEHSFTGALVHSDEVNSTVSWCSCGAEQIRWNAENYNESESYGVSKGNATGVSGDTNTGTKLTGDVYNKTQGTASEGAHAVYNIYVPTTHNNAKLLMKGVRNSSSTVSMFSAQTNDISKSYYEETPGEEWVRYPWRYKLIVNGVDIPFIPYTTENPEPKTGTRVYFEVAFPCTFDLQLGMNKIELQKWGGYILVITELAFQY